MENKMNKFLMFSEFLGKVSTAQYNKKKRR